MGFYHSITPLLEIVIISVMLNYLLSFFWNTRSMDLAVGLLAFLLILFSSSWFNLPVLHYIMLVLGNVAMIGVLVIFQPEFRIALSKLSFKGRRQREITEFDRFLDQLTTSVFRMADKKVGALIVIENKDLLDEYAQKAVALHSHFSPELLETIFSVGTPLHDGAVILRDKTIVGASVILPLADDTSQVAKGMGTRHRAALGLSQLSDALIIVVSEESGKVSIAREGIITKNVKLDRFKGVIRSIFNPPLREIKPKRKFLEWIRT